MSYWATLEDSNGNTVELSEVHHEAGGTYALGGTTEATLNITYNYSGWFGKVFPDTGLINKRGLRYLHKMTAANSLPVLRTAIANLGTDTDPDYWKATQGNARAALESLLRLAKTAPADSVWRIS
jgi:hypothetical protein